MHRMILLSFMVLSVCGGTAAHGQLAKFPMELGEAVATCFSGFNTPGGQTSGIKLNAPVAGVVDVRDPLADGAVKNTNWAARMFHNENAGANEWNAGNLGQVFGITLDDENPPNIYLTATTAYGLFKTSANVPEPGSFGPNGGPGAVYKLSGTTGQIIVFAKLPQASTANPVTGPGLGDIAYDRVNRQFFVSNFYDGKIYRLAGVAHASTLAPGSIVDSYDFGTTHFNMPDPLVDQSPAYRSNNTSGGASGFRPVGRRPWAVQVYAGRLFFSNWAMDSRATALSLPNTIWSMPVPAGTAPFNGNAMLEVTMSRPLRNNQNIAYSNPVSDIAFSAAGKMLVSERGMPNGDVGSFVNYPGHQSRVFEYTGGSGNWGPATPFQIGGGPLYISGIRSNSEGGVDYGYDLFNYRTETPVTARECDATVWATGELVLGYATGIVPYVYGLQAIPATGNTFVGSPVTATNPGYTPLSYGIDLGGAPTTSTLDKLRIGDVEVYRESCFPKRCLTLTSAKALCTTDNSGDYLLTFTFKNLTPDTIYHLFLSGLSAGTASPSYIDLTQAPYSPIPPGGMATIGPIRIHGASPGALTFTISIHNIDLEQCCATEVTVELPPCDCAQVTDDDGPFCPFFFGTKYPYFFTLQNLFPSAISYVLVTPDTPSTATFASNIIDLTANPIGINGSANLIISIGNVQPGQQVCFRITTVTDEFEECCSIRQCITIPRCFIDVGPFEPVDSTVVLAGTRGLTIEDPRGDPGGRFPLAADTEGVDLEWLPIDGNFAAGSFVEQRLRGSVDGGAETTIAATRIVRAGEGSELRTSLAGIGSSRYRYEFYRDGVLVGFQPGVPSDVAAIVNSGQRLPSRDAHFVVSGHVPASQENAATCSGPSPGCIFAGYTFQDSFLLRLAGFAETYDADEVRVFPENVTATRIRPSALEFQSHGPTRITFTEFRMRADCNDNGVDDADDIAKGTSLDLDRDGIPDECDSNAPPAVSLSTGFDQTAGVVSARGGDDDDWRIVTPGPERAAKVVLHPHPNWPAALPLSQWISVDGDRGTSLPGVTQLAFQRCFCLADGAGDVAVDLQLRADNEGSVFLNGQKLAGPGGALNAGPLVVRPTGKIGDGLFVAGQNCLKVEVNDFGFFTALDLAGVVTVSGATCTPP